MAKSTNDHVAALLQEAAETHHRVYRITDGTDDDWASWYANWLLTLSELPQLLATRPVRSHLVHALVQLDRDHAPAAERSVAGFLRSAAPPVLRLRVGPRARGDRRSVSPRGRRGRVGRPPPGG